MKKSYTILIVLTFFLLKSNAQTIKGVITDYETKEPLIGVNIILTEGGGTSTDLFGKYNLKLKSGKQNLIFKYIGYKEIVKEIQLNKDDAITLNIALQNSEEQLSTIVVSAGRFEQKIEEITVSMEVLKPSLIENKNTTNIQTAMDQVPGVNITDGQANIRGGSGWSYGAGTRVLVMVDDMPLISGDAGQAQWSLIATENINQIEVIKGASSALYGSSALNGVINVRTAFPSLIDINKSKFPGYTKVNMHFGLIDKPKRDELNWNGEKRRSFKGVEFLQSMKFSNLDISFGGNIFKDDGYRFGEKTDRKRFNLNSTYKSKSIQGLSFGLNANLLSQNSGSLLLWKSLEEAYIPSGDEITTTNGKSYNIDPSITYISGNNRHSLKTRHLSVKNINLTNGIDAGQSNLSKTYYTDYQWQKNISNKQLRITTGITYERSAANSDLFNGESSRTNHSFYTQLDKKIGKINLSIGGRYESFALNSEEKYLVNSDSIKNFSAAKPVFRTGINYQIAEATYLRSSWGQGYRFPSMAELFISTNQSGLEIYPNPGLKPESGWSSEIGIKQGFKTGKWMGYIDIAGFIQQYDNMMEFTFGKWEESEGADNFYGLGFKSLNVGTTQISGIELSISGQGKINSNLTINLIAGYTYMDPISLSPEETIAIIEDGIYLNGENITNLTYTNSSSDPSILKYRYKHIAKSDVEVIYKKTSLGFSVRYNDFMKNIDQIFTEDLSLLGIYGINEARDKFEDGDIIIDLRAGYQIIKTVRAGLIVNNLFNREYMSRPASMMTPRTIAMQLAVKI